MVEGFNLQLEEYCSSCADFEVEHILIDSGRLLDRSYHCAHIIKCKNADKCARIRENLKRGLDL